MEISLEKFKKNLVKSILLSAFFVLYLISFLLIFFSKGIFVGENFYKKSANINSITYSATKNALPKQIILQKKIGGSNILIVDGVSILLSPKGEIEYPDGYSPQGLSESEIQKIALQQSETHRGSQNKTWLFVALIYITFMLIKNYNTQIYSFFNKDKAPRESYYKLFDAIFTIFCIAALVYIIISL